jgi:hypothetical protein
MFANTSKNILGSIVFCLRGVSPQAYHTDRATAEVSVNVLRIEGCRIVRSLTDVISVF